MIKKATGITRKIDPLGRIVVPKEVLTSMNIKHGDPLEIFVGDNGEVILKKYNPGCHECGSVDVRLYGDKVKICIKCVRKMEDF
jgi:AbrB family transcriptional regulator, transcriptional pleiotropic regulator of transition state genes